MKNQYTGWLKRNTDYVGCGEKTIINESHAKGFYHYYWTNAFNQLDEIYAQETIWRMSQIPRLFIQIKNLAYAVRCNVTNDKLLPKRICRELTGVQNTLKHYSQCQPNNEDYRSLIEYVIFLKVVARRKRYLFELRELSKYPELKTLANYLTVIFARQPMVNIFIN
jgi:hypothetical protein